MALSGPTAGAIGASYVGRLAGYPDVISIDVGGTSADICLKDYGVVLEPQTLEVDEVETARLRKKLAEKRRCSTVAGTCMRQKDSPVESVV